MGRAVHYRLQNVCAGSPFALNYGYNGEKEYSAHTTKHYNHTLVHRGVCVTTTCKHFINNRDLNKVEDLNDALEACINDSLWRGYSVQGKLAQIDYCKKEGDEVVIDASDMFMAAVYIVIIILNVGGSLYDVLKCKEDVRSGNPYLIAFSIRRNWAKLVTPSGGGPDPRLRRLKLFHGLRTMTMVCVFFSHTVLIMAFSFVNNPLYIEKAYEDPLKQILFNGSLVTHTFFVMSSFLLAYNFRIHEERQPPRWTHWPRGVLLRWIRLTPAYALVLGTLCTWARHAGDGPLWDLVVGSEARACRRYWWAHLLYINNYLYEDAHCAPQTWYLAADTQLFCAALLLLVAGAGAGRRAPLLLLLLLAASLLAPAAHTYFQDLPAVVIQAPETYRSLYAHDDTFRLVYIRGHTNLSTYTLGLAGGLLAHRWHARPGPLAPSRKLAWLVWALFPLAVAVILSGGLFYSDGDPPSTALRVLYATLYKPVFQTLVVMFIIACVFKVESVYRGIVEWRGFTWTGRVSYCAFLLHTLVQRALAGAQAQPTHMSDCHVLVVLSGTIFLSFLGAAALWLCVEAPVAAVVRAATGSGASSGAAAGATATSHPPVITDTSKV